MCGRIIQSSGPIRLAIVEGLDVSDSRMGNARPRYNAAPSQEFLIIRENHKTRERSLDLIRWGLIPHWCQDPRVGESQLTLRLRASPGFRRSGMLMLSGGASCQSMASSSGAR